MGLEIKPAWDRSDTVRLTLRDQRRELVVSAGGGRPRDRLWEDAPDRLGWVERRHEQGLVRRRRVAVGDVVCACLREWDAEQWVIELSLAAAARAHRRGGPWERPPTWPGWPAYRGRR